MNGNGSTGETGNRWHHGALISAFAATAYSVFYLQIPTRHDEWLALPIAREGASPGTYAANDLLVESGLRAPFHLYHAAAWLYRSGANVDAWWFALLVTSLFFFFLASWRLARVVTGSALLAALTTALLAVMPSHRGTLHSTAVPMLSFNSAAAAIPIALFGLAFAFESRWRLSLALCGAAFLLHPSIGLLAISTTALLMVVERPRIPVRERVTALGIGVAVMLPNVVYLLANSRSNFAPPDTELLNDVRRLADHAFPVQFFSQEYGAFALLLAFAALGAQTLAQRPRRMARIAIAWLLLVMTAYGVCMTIYPLPAVLQFYAFRATVFVKPLLLAAIVSGGVATLAAPGSREQRVVRFLIVLLAVLGFTHRNPAVADGLLLFAAGIVLTSGVHRNRAGTWLAVAVATTGVVSLALLFGDPARATLAGWAFARNGALVATALWLAVAVARRDVEVVAADPPRLVHRFGTAALFATAIVVAHAPFGGWLPRSPAAIRSAIRLSDPDGQGAGVMRWARDFSPTHALFAVPPYATEFIPFRLQAGRSIWISSFDLGQLTYDVPAFRAGVTRLLLAGGRRTDDGFDMREYSVFPLSRARILARLGVDFAVVDAWTARRRTASLPVPYMDDRWAVLDLRSLRRDTARAAP